MSQLSNTHLTSSNTWHANYLEHEPPCCVCLWWADDKRWSVNWHRIGFPSVSYWRANQMKSRPFFRIHRFFYICEWILLFGLINTSYLIIIKSSSKHATSSVNGFVTFFTIHDVPWHRQMTREQCWEKPQKYLGSVFKHFTCSLCR